MLFQNLLELYPKTGNAIQLHSLRNQWVLLVEKEIFALTEQLTSDEPYIDFEIHMRDIECEIGIPNSCKLAIQYSEEI